MPDRAVCPSWGVEQTADLRSDIMDKNPEIDTTRFVNIDDQPFDIYINGKLARHLEPKEEQTIVLYVAQVGAKHLVDKILQKQGVKDTLRDTELRRDTFAKILPHLAEELKIKPLTPEEREKELEKRLKEQEEKLNALLERGKEGDEKDKKIASLEEAVEKLKKALEPAPAGESADEPPRRGRPRKE